MQAIKKFFKLEEVGSNLNQEIRAGFSIFLTMAYIIVLNPRILAQGGFPLHGVYTATVLTAAVTSIVMGLFANVPFAMASGMGLNSFIAIELCTRHMVSWQTALGMIVLYGLISFILMLSPVRKIAIHAIPRSIRYAGAAGIGLFLVLIGFKSSGILPGDPIAFPYTQGFSFKVFFFAFGLMLSALLVIKKKKGALIIGILATSALNFLLIFFQKGFAQLPQTKTLFSLPDFSTMFAFNFSGIFKFELLIPLYLLFFTDIFDSVCCASGLCESGKLQTPEGNPKNLGRTLIADSFGTLFAGISGTSPSTLYIESISGIIDGGKTGIAAIVTGLLFLPFLFFSPLIELIPAYASAPALVISGIFMMSSIVNINWRNLEEAIPAGVALILIPASNSISVGISWSFLFYSILKLLLGKWREVHLSTWIIDICFIVILLLQW